MASVDISSLNTQLGAYHRINDREIYTSIFEKLEFDQHFQSVPNIKHQYVASNATMSSLLQQYQKAWTPQGQATFDAVINEVKQVKFDVDIEDVDAIMQSWIGFLNDMPGDERKNRKDWPLVRYIYSELMVAKMREELNDAAYNAVYVAPTVGVAGSSTELFDGVKHIIEDAITATNITPIATGAITATNIVDRVEFFVDNLPVKYRNMPGEILMSSTNARRYWRDYRADFGTNSNYTGKDNLGVDATNKMVVGTNAMEGSDRFIFTPKWNRIKMFDKIYEPNQFTVEEYRRLISVHGRFTRGYGFRFWDFLFVNDQT